VPSRGRPVMIRQQTARQRPLLFVCLQKTEFLLNVFSLNSKAELFSHYIEKTGKQRDQISATIYNTPNFVATLIVLLEVELSWPRPTPWTLRTRRTLSLSKTTISADMKMNYNPVPGSYSKHPSMAATHGLSGRSQ